MLRVARATADRAGFVARGGTRTLARALQSPGHDGHPGVPAPNTLHWETPSMNTTSLLPFRWKMDEDKGFVQLQQAMNELLQNLHQPAEWPLLSRFYPAGNGRTWMPRLDVCETEKEIIVTAELPGLEEKDVNVSLSGDQLVISGEKREEKEEKNKTFHRIERNWGSFQRVLPLYWEVDRNAIKAIFCKGVLTVTLVKTLKAQEMIRKIPVKTA